jgi:hypothetical protein
MNITTATTWIGWHRPDPCSPWRALVTAESETVAFNRLLDSVRGGDKCVLPAGTDPNVAALAPRAGRCPDEIRE